MNQYIRLFNGIAVEVVESDKPLAELFHPAAGFVEVNGAVEVGAEYNVVDGVAVRIQPKPLTKAQQAEIDAQAMFDAVEAVKHALQSHIDNVAKGLGFSGGNALMLYAGFANDFQPIAQKFGAWEAAVWVAADDYMTQVKAGAAPLLSPEQAVSRIPVFEAPETTGA